jgi:hydroxyethylthiazole kinase
MISKCLENVRKNAPLVHSITNYVTVNDCANVLLACGASPIMADDKAEVEEITSICNATVINIGTLNQRTIESMLLAGKKANQLGHPVVLDPVGAGASALRTDTANKLLSEVEFAVIRGNISEIKTLALGFGTTQGVDADIADKITDENLPQALEFIRAFSKKTGAIIAVSGAIDIVSNKEHSFIIKNGHPAMSKITGSGCMLTCLTAAYVAANPGNPLSATAAAFVLMGLAGEKAAKISENTGSMRMNILDGISEITAEELKAGAKIEEF